MNAIVNEATHDFYGDLVKAGYPKFNLLEEILSEDNLSDSFDYVISHLDNKFQRKIFSQKKDKVISTLRKEIADGTFRIMRDDVKDMEVFEGNKLRRVQAPRIDKRIGCHAVMVVVEKIIYPTLINNTAASIKGKGMHWLFHILEEDLKVLQKCSDVFFYQSDYSHYYDNISQDIMKKELRHYIGDTRVLPILDNFIELLDHGLSKGLRSSQCFANMYHSWIDHEMNTMVGNVIRDGENHYLYYRYMDDIVIIGTNKKLLWKYRDRLKELASLINLEIKPSEAVRPLEVGIDYLGFVNFGTHVRLRKRTKQNAARKLARVKSRKRRQEIIGSFKGMACHADCKNLFKLLTHQKMKKFSEIGVNYIPEDGKKRFPGRIMSLSSMIGEVIEVHDYQSDVDTKHGHDRYVVSCKRKDSEEWFKFFTASEEMKSLLNQISEIEGGFPFETKIAVEYFDGGKRMYKFT